MQLAGDVASVSSALHIGLDFQLLNFTFKTQWALVVC
jgi:hypothetical protein